jgi:hypothetical protein
MRLIGLAVVLAVSLVLSGCVSASSSSAPPTVDVTGVWEGAASLGGGASTPVTLRLRQDGAGIAGNVDVGGFMQYSGALQGSVRGAHLSYKLLSGRSGAELVVNGEEMTGYSATGARLMLRRQR